MFGYNPCLIRLLKVASPTEIKNSEDLISSIDTLFANASVVSEDFDKGLTLFAYQRNRKPYDNNDDGYSEITKLHNTTFGADAFWNPTDNSKIKLNLNSINEFRRGGNKFDLLPHESDITEQPAKIGRASCRERV